MNPWLKSTALALANGTGFLALKRHFRRSCFRVVTYHGVQADADPVRNGDRLQVSPEVFEQQVTTLARVFRIVPLREAVAHWLERGEWPPGALAMTFDDGYRNNLEVAAPILRRLGVPATFFVTGGYIEDRLAPWWYALRAALARRLSSAREARAQALALEARLRPMPEGEREAELRALGVDPAECPYPLMTRGECIELVAQGFDVQAHSWTHVSFGAESPDRIAHEIRSSVEFTASLGARPWGFAYPYGHEPKDLDAAAAAMQACGLLAAFSTCEGANDRRAARWRLNRWDLNGGYTPTAMLARVS